MKRFSGMKRVVALTVSAVLSFQLLAGKPQQAHAAEAAVNLQLDVKSAILMDAGTGQILYENNPDVALPPASMAKMMTEYIVMENIKSGKFKWDDIVTTTKYAADMPGSGRLLANGEKLPLKSMFQAMSIYSGNDATVALAEFVAGSEENFAKMMNDKAKELGLTTAHFVTSTGLSKNDLKGIATINIEGETVMSARDAATLAYRIVKDHPEVLDFTKIPSLKLRERDKDPMINWNWMLEGNKDVINFKKYAYQGLDGLKTGHTDEAGFCFTATAQRNGMRLISVVMGTTSEPKRFEETRKVLDYGFNNFEKKDVLAPNTTIDSLQTVDVKKGKKTTVPVATETGVTMIVKKGMKDDEITKKTEAIDESKRVAPIKKGDKMGTLTLTYQGKDTKVNLVATEDVDKASWIRLLFRAIGNFFGDLFSSIKNLF